MSPTDVIGLFFRMRKGALLIDKGVARCLSDPPPNADTEMAGALRSIIAWAQQIDQDAQALLVACNTKQGD